MWQSPRASRKMASLPLQRKQHQSLQHRRHQHINPQDIMLPLWYKNKSQQRTWLVIPHTHLHVAISAHEHSSSGGIGWARLRHAVPRETHNMCIHLVLCAQQQIAHMYYRITQTNLCCSKRIVDVASSSRWCVRRHRTQAQQQITPMLSQTVSQRVTTHASQTQR